MSQTRKMLDQDRILLSWIINRGGRIEFDRLLKEFSYPPIPALPELSDVSRIHQLYEGSFHKLRKDGYLVEEEPPMKIILTPQGKQALLNQILPVQKILTIIKDADLINFQDLFDKSQLDKDEMQIVVSYAQKRSWIEVDTNNQVSMTTDGKTVLEKSEFSELMDVLVNIGNSSKNMIYFDGVSTSQQRRLRQRASALKKMQLVNIEKNPSVIIKVTSMGEDAIKRKKVLTSDDLRYERFRESSFKLEPCDLDRQVKPTMLGRLDPVTIQLNDVRSIFSQFGFEEERIGPVEFQFWNFDLLLFPPEHPDRANSHVYSLEKKNKEAVIDYELEEKLADYWTRKLDFEFLSPSQIRTRVLRTHSTPAMVRSIRRSTGEQRRFSVSQVYTREQGAGLSYHAEGIMVGRETSLVSVVEMIKSIYERLSNLSGVEPVINNTYYPFTMPSVVVRNPHNFERIAAGGMIRPEILELIGNNSTQYLVGAFALFIHFPESTESGFQTGSDS